MPTGTKAAPRRQAPPPPAAAPPEDLVSVHSAALVLGTTAYRVMLMALNGGLDVVPRPGQSPLFTVQSVNALAAQRAAVGRPQRIGG